MTIYRSSLVIFAGFVVNPAVIQNIAIVPELKYLPEVLCHNNNKKKINVSRF